jgi:SAM-dependent methyltransferase
LALTAIENVLSRHGVRIDELPQVLDFGCGCGRVIRHLQDRSSAIHGCDTDAGAIRWCRRNLANASFATTGLEPPLPYGDGQFGLVYALSVFTHLPERLQQAWIAELRRVLSPDGYLVITVHGNAYREALASSERIRFDAGEMVLHAGAPGSNQCAAYHPEPYVRAVLAHGFAVLDYEQEGALGNPRQDLVLLQK